LLADLHERCGTLDEQNPAGFERGGALRALINAGKAWVIAYQEGVPVSEYVREMVHDHILQTGARFRETGARLRALSNAVKVWLIAYHECVAVRILCVAHCVEILEIQAIARFKS
jgi:hypothetical protein